jgi:beta-barrel assembly-enhancing protease
MSAFFRSAGIAAAISLTACAPTVQQEIEMGNQYAQEIARTMPLIRDPALTSALQTAVAPLLRVVKRQELAWSFNIVNSDQVNAFAVPGGHVYVFRGLIERADHYDELAGVLGHEMGHVDLRHSAEQMGQANAANTGVGLAYLLLGRQPGQVEQAALGVTANFVFAKFSRDDEREADSVAVGYLTRASINPEGLTRMFQTLERLQEREPSKVEQWFASHPIPAERVANVRRIIDATPGADAAVRDGRTDLAAFDQLKRGLRALPPAPNELPSQ